MTSGRVLAARFFSRPSFAHSARSRKAVAGFRKNHAQLKSQGKNRRRKPDLRQINPAVEGPGSSRSARRKHKKDRRQNAARRVFVNSAPAGAARAEAQRARLTAFHRGTCGSEPTPPLSLRRTSWDLVEKQVLPVSACPSPAT
jgi:hypothetical protein